MSQRNELMPIDTEQNVPSVAPESQKRFRTLIFDFDGTIADTLSAIIKLVNEHASELNIKPLAEKDVEELRGMSNLDIIKKFKLPLFKVPSIVLRAQKELNQRIDEITLFPGVKELVLALKERSFHLGILTSNSRENVLKFLRAQALDVFDFIHAEQNFFGKNWALLHLLKKFNLKKEEVIYVGDEVRDIEACQKVSVPVIAVSWGFHRKQVLMARNPTYLVDSPDEIRKIVFG
jgi:phosphoglycolate phosphatase